MYGAEIFSTVFALRLEIENLLQAADGYEEPDRESGYADSLHTYSVP